MFYQLPVLGVKRLYRDIGFASGLFLEFYETIYFGMQSMIFACVYIFTGVMLCSALSYDDIAGNSSLPSKDLDPESFRF